ncbi:MAG: hypothetical protein O2958_00255 [Gemmatimonadetes bacterium]|nr:hypothetical protein [Gemmatimonadota bacterium]
MGSDDANRERLTGRSRTKTTLLRPCGDYLRRVLLPWVPRRIETWHLTGLTVPLAALVVLAGFLAGTNIQWIWLISGAVVLQYIADLLDGALGRARGTGLVYWGFYMDHLSDAVFMGAVIAAYVPIYPDSTPILIGILIAASALFLHEALACVCTGAYNWGGHHGLGLEEGRLLVILVNMAVVVSRPVWIHWVFVAVLILLGFILIEQSIVTQRRLWTADFASRDRERAANRLVVAGFGDDPPGLPGPS